ncbi:hypothetical protein MBLNU457_5263t1 [Dothideomycetes sp. NU457]
MLPLGQRVLQKLERLVDKHMTSVGASKVSLSSITSETLWKQTGRYSGHGSEFFKVKDRRKAQLLLSPTHEEEITNLVGSVIKSYKDLPLRLYQVSRKYRDEARPRQGLLRGREFLMKDLYTFDEDETKARETYDQVRQAYNAFFTDLGVPFVVAQADSGAMGGDLSHEYHLVSPDGEDSIVKCNACNTAMNDELVISEHDPTQSMDEDYSAVSPNSKYGTSESSSWYGLSKDGHTLVEAIYPTYSTVQSTPTEIERVKNQVHLPAIKAVLPAIELQTGLEDPRKFWKGGFDHMHLTIIDSRLPAMNTGRGESHRSTHDHVRARADGKDILLTKPINGDLCTNCRRGPVEVLTAIEVGHTFHLGTRYSKPLNASIATLSNSNQITPVEMGCHGIGVSRLIAAIASIMSDSKGLVWPAVISPFSVVVVHLPGLETQAEEVISKLQFAAYMKGATDKLDVMLDDRSKRIGWQLHDADLIGYPIIIVVGRSYEKEGTVQVQCRRLGFDQHVPVAAVPDLVSDQLQEL